jgi:hypothetical protein
MSELLDIRQLFYSLENLCDKWEPYLDIYETWFHKFRGKSPRILEIGVYKGGSAELWRDYFGTGTFIIGVDIDPSTKQYETDDFKVVIGDAADPKTFWNHSAFFKEQFDIVIDDGGHHMQQQISALKICYEMVKENGIYLCEDTHTSYYDHWPEAGLESPASFVNYSKRVIDVLSEEHQYKGPDGEVFTPKTKVDEELVKLYKNTRAIHFYNSVVVLEKGPQPEFKRVFSKKDFKNVVSNVRQPGPIPGDGILRINTKG